ncbi:MAG: nucleotide exchange factor GrpE [Candidatus Tectomicrobia bacterium]|nr:nucleotide exchange factor GrpE [Candidatus Tectomicrobia bacterium]
MTEAHHSRWRETRAMLTDLLAWLDATQQWVETTGADPDAYRSRDRLNPDMEPEVSVSAPRAEPEQAPEAEATARPDLFALLAEMTALRQEVKLQTRSARSDREQAAQTLDQLSSVVAEVIQPQQTHDAPPDHVAVDALVELHDALSRVERQGRLLMTETVRTLREWGRQAAPLGGPTMRHGASELSEPIDRLTPQTPEPQPRCWLRRWRREPIPSPAPVPPPDPEAAQRAAAWRQIGREAEPMADRLDGLSTGYELGVQRLDRLLAACGIEPIECVGKPVDAELMEVVQLVTESGQPDGVVVDEVRRGYRRDGQVYRFAQVVAARMPSPEAGAPLTEECNTQQEVD